MVIVTIPLAMLRTPSHLLAAAELFLPFILQAA
jgi:hypothetical protein